MSMMNTTPPLGRVGQVPKDDSLSQPIMVALFVFSITQPYLFNFGGFIMAPYRLLLLILLVPLLLNWVQGKYNGFILPDFLVFGHMLWMPICMIANGQTGGMVVYVMSQFVDIVGGYMLGRAAIRNKEDVVFFVRWMVGVLLFLMPFAAFESITKVMVLHELAKQIPMAQAHHPSTLTYPPRFGMQRAQTATPHPILYGITSAMIFSMAWMILPHAKKPITGKVKRIGLLSGSLGGAFFALSAGGWMNVMTQIGFMSYNRILRTFKARWKLFVWGFAAFYIFLVFYSERPPFVVLSRMVALDQQTAFFRFLIYKYGSAEVARNPIFGLGLFSDYIRPHWMVPSVDNHWLLQAMRWGWPGFLTLLGAAFYPIYKLGVKDFRGNRALSDIRYAMIFSMVSFYISMATVAVWNIQYSLIMFMMGATVWLIKIDPPAEEGPSDGAPQAPSPQGDQPSKRGRYTRFEGRSGVTRTTRSKADEGARPAPRRRPHLPKSR